MAQEEQLTWKKQAPCGCREPGNLVGIGNKTPVLRDCS